MLPWLQTTPVQFVKNNVVQMCVSSIKFTPIRSSPNYIKTHVLEPTLVGLKKTIVKHTFVQVVKKNISLLGIFFELSVLFTSSF